MIENTDSTLMVKIETAEDYKKQSEINDMRQHANKIIQGIKKLNHNDANRAIWELFQNAVDLSNECHIEIKISTNTLEFSHNGQPFTPMTLDCLFKQVSSKTLEERKETYDKTDPIGQYGTGFITSHIFGKELVIDGAISKGEGYIPLCNFLINRNTDNWQVLAKSIRDLKGEVAKLLEDHDRPIPKPYPRTRFTYKLSSEQNLTAAKNAIASLRCILPYVMTLNPNLKSVAVIDGDSVVIYKKGELFIKDEMIVREININDDIQEICYLEADQGKVTIILPMDSEMNTFELDEALPRLFLYYPLIGTEKLGINFIINSRQFQPTEPRNGLFLNSDNESNSKDEQQNRSLIETASQRIFAFLKIHTERISSPIKLATINFPTKNDDEFLNTYFKQLKDVWISAFRDLPLVETSDGIIEPTKAQFIHSELLTDETSFEASHSLANKFWVTIPKKELVKEWTEKIDEWELTDVTYLTAEDIVEKIEEVGDLGGFDKPEQLKDFYRLLIATGRLEVFNAHRILPNIKGEFRFLSGNEGLNNSTLFSNELVEIADVIMPMIPKRHVHPEFKFDFEFADYTRKKYATDILEYIGKLVTDRTISTDLEGPFLSKFLDYCKITTTIDSSSVPKEMIRLVAKHYQKSEDMIFLSSLKEDELDLRAPRKKMVRLLLNDISQYDSVWVKEHIQSLIAIISTGSTYEAYEEMFQALSVFPNELFELTKQSLLHVDEIFDDNLKNLYDEVVRPSLPIRAIVVRNEFKTYLKDKKTKTIRDLTEKIESSFFDGNVNLKIQDHPFKKQILDIIDQIKGNPEYAKHFPLVFSKRSSILVELADGEDTFTILSLDSSRIKDLAELGSNPFFDQIVKLGKEALTKQQIYDANFQHKYAIGTHIEKLLRIGLTNIIPENIEAIVQNVQDGQDIIIKINGNSVYYIEVKSRWEANPVRMSKNQTLQADKQKDNYALCLVDMIKYNGKDKFNIKEIKEIEHCVSFDVNIGYEVSHLVDVLNQTNIPDSIHLDGDYRTLVPARFIENGYTLPEFEAFIVLFFQKNAVLKNL